MIHRESALSSYVIREIRPPSRKGLNGDLEWIARSLGFVEARDKGKSAMKIFRVLVEQAGRGRGLASEQISNHVDLSRGAVVAHLNRMMASGLAIRQENKYELRVRSVEQTINEIEKDISRVLHNVREIAREVDGRMGLRYRR